MLRVIVAALAGLMAVAIAPARAQGIADPGERAFQYCFSCHSVMPGEQEGLQGPNLKGLMGRSIASLAGFSYSEALKSFGAGKIWTPELIATFIQDPEKLVPGTLMQKPPGPRRAEERDALIRYLADQN